MITVTLRLIVVTAVLIITTSATLLSSNYFENNFSKTVTDSITVDTDSKIHDIGITQPSSKKLSSLLNSESDEAAVLTFIISDSGLRDSLPTRVTQFIIRALPNQTADWSKSIAGARLFDGITPIVSSPVIKSTSITFNFNVGVLTVEDRSTKTLTLKIFFKHNGSLIDDNSFGFQINAVTDAQAEFSDSQFDSKFSYTVKSNLFFMDVEASRLCFTTIPNSIISRSKFSVSVNAIDINGCVDTDCNASITLSLDIGTGRLASLYGLVKSASKGKCTLDNLSYSGLGIFTMKASSENLSSAFSEGIKSEVRFFWTRTAPMNSSRSHHAAVLLNDGRVLVIGNHNNGSGSASCEIFNPDNGSWSSNSNLNMMFARERLTATVLQNGDVLAAGGMSSRIPTFSCEIFNVSEQRWYTAPAMNAARSNHSVTVLHDGRILIAGANDGGSGIASCEIFELFSQPNYSNQNTIGRWISTSSMHTQRGIHTATLLTNGKVLVAGGLNNHAANASCEIYDPVKDTWTNVASMNFPRFAHTATLLPNGKVLVTGGGDYGDLKSCEMFDPFANNGFGDWKVVAPMSKGRMFHAATLLNDGSVLVTGNWEGGIGSTSCEVFKYSNANSTGEWRTIEDLNVRRGCHTATLLKDGSVFVVGGEFSGQTATAECEITTPIILNVENTIADKFILHQNYPNPLHTSTIIEYAINERTHVRLEVFDDLGHKVLTLVDEEKDAGEYTSTFRPGEPSVDIRNLLFDIHPGVLFYRLTVGKNVITKKMIVIK